MTNRMTPETLRAWMDQDPRRYAAFANHQGLAGTSSWSDVAAYLQDYSHIPTIARDLQRDLVALCRGREIDQTPPRP